MSLLHKPDENQPVKPVISKLLPPSLEAIKQGFQKELEELDQLLGKIYQAIHKTVHKMHTDPDTMWLHIDFQAEAIDETIKKFCQWLTQTLSTQSPPDTPEEAQGIKLLVQQLEWDLYSRYSVEEYVEELLNRLEIAGPETLPPQEWIGENHNLHIDPRDYNIAGYPGRPLPTSSWWLYLAHRLGAGYRMMTVVSENVQITDPLSSIGHNAARFFDPEVQIGAQILIPFARAFPPNVNQGCYLLKNHATGIEFAQTERFDVKDATLSADFSYTLIAGSLEQFEHPPVVSSYDDHCVTLHHQKDGASLTIPLTRGSPYITLLYQNCTPAVRVTGKTIDPESIESKEEGRVFLFKIRETQEWYCVFSSIPIQFKTVNAHEKMFLPEGVPLPEKDAHDFHLHQQGKAPYSTTRVYEEHGDMINGLEALQPYARVTLRIAKIPAHLSQEEGLALLLQHAWVYATGSRMHVTEEGSWAYTYIVQHIHPPETQPQELLIALLQADEGALLPEYPRLDLVYQTLYGPARCALATEQQLQFSLGLNLIHRADESIQHMSEEQRQVLGKAFIHSAEGLDLKARGFSTLHAARHIQNAAEAAHAMFTLLQSDPNLIDNSPFMTAFQTTLSIAKAGLDDYLSGNLLQYDPLNHIVMTTLDRDIYTACGKDHHRLFGYLIRAAADLDEIVPDWFDRRRRKIVDLLVNEICCPYDQSPYFPKARQWDLYTGLGRGSGATTPQSIGMSDESIGEDLGSLLGIALWAKGRDRSLEYFAATLAERLYAAAQNYCLPKHLKFNKKVLCCGIRSDIQISSQNTLNLEGDPLLFTLAAETMGNATWIDQQTAIDAFELLFSYELKSFDYERFVDQFSRAPLFQNKVRKQVGVPIDRYMSAITALIPLIARVSPHTADAVLEWYRRSHLLDPNNYPLLTTAQYPLMKMQIVAEMQRCDDPIPSPIPENDWPFLPEDTHTSPLQFWLDKTDKWRHTSNLSADAYKLIDHVYKEIVTLIAHKGTIQDLHVWAHSIILPAISEEVLSNISARDLYPFCIITQTDPQEIVGHQPQERETPIQQAPLHHEAFLQIKAEITAYLSERMIHLYQAQSFLGLPQKIPTSASEWSKLSTRAQLKLQQLQTNIASCRNPSHWTALAAKYGFRGTILQIQKQAAHALHILSDLLSAQLALTYFLQALTRITLLEMGNGSAQDLAQWAKEFKTAGLTRQDLSIWNVML